MQDKFDEIRKYARDKRNKVIAKIKKDDDADAMNIESYEGDDAFYSGSDEEYEEFLKSVDGDMNVPEDAEPVENTQRINLGETINIQSVIDKFKKKAGEFTAAAKNVKDDIADKIEDFKSAASEPENGEAEDGENTGGTRFEKLASELKNIDVEGIKNQIADSVKDSKMKFENVKDGISSITARFDACEDKIGDVSEKLDTLSEKVQLIEDGQSDINGNLMEIKQAVTAVSKLSDSVFDLKNSQVNAKNSLAELELGFLKLKRKCVLGVTILSILSAIAIALQVVTLLS